MSTVQRYAQKSRTKAEREENYKEVNSAEVYAVNGAELPHRRSGSTRGSAAMEFEVVV